MSVLVIVEHDNQDLKPATYHTVTAAKQFSDNITLVIIGYQCHSVLEQAKKISVIQKVLIADNIVFEHQLAENTASLLVEISKQHDFVLAPATTFGKNLLPRLAALLDVSQVSDVVKIISNDTFVHPIYAGDLLETVKSLDSIKIVTIRTTAFDLCKINQTENAEITTEKIDLVFEKNQTKFVERKALVSSRPELTNARVVVSGGRGLQNKENFALLEALGDKLNAAVGATRAAVDAGFVSNVFQVGQTGKVVAPDLYIAVGLSGAIQHLAGMKDSKVIVAINKNEEAPIFKVADYGLVADLFDVVPEMIEKL